MVLASLDSGPKIDPSKIQIEVPQGAPSEIPHDRVQIAARRQSSGRPGAIIVRYQAFDSM